MTWYKKILTKYKKEIIESAIVSVLVTASFSLWYYFQGKSFVWTEIDPISVPTVPSRLFYSALVFVTLGALLYHIDFYKFLADNVGRGLGDWQLDNGIKRIIWVGLIYIMYSYIIPTFVNILNVSASFIYNIWQFILYMAPPIGVLILFFLIYKSVNRYFPKQIAGQD